MLCRTWIKIGHVTYNVLHKLHNWHWGTQIMIHENDVVTHAFLMLSFNATFGSNKEKILQTQFFFPPKLNFPYANKVYKI